MSIMKEESSNPSLKLLSCRACLATDVKLFNLFNNNLAEAFTHITGTIVQATDGLPQHLCCYCRSTLLKCGVFRARTLRAQQCLRAIPLHEVTIDYIRSIDRHTHKLLHLTQTGIETIDYLDLDINKEDSESVKVLIDTDVLKDSKEDLELDIKKEDSKTDQTCSDILKVEFETRDNTDEAQDNDNIENVFVTTNPMEERRERRKKQAILKRNPVRVREGRKKKAIEKRVKKRCSDNDYFPDFDFGKFESSYGVKIVALTKKQQLEEIEARKQSANYKYAAYKCEECGKGFMANDAYNNHKIRHSASMGAHACEICRVRFKRQSRRQEHQDLHRLKFLCKECSFVSRNRNQARKHFESHSGKIYECKYCGKSFTKSSSYLTHVRKKHRAMNVACDVCGDTFVGRIGLLQHKSRAHKTAPEKPLPRCSECGCQFECADALNKHVPCDPHTRPCLVCGENLSTEEELQAHSNERHSADQFKCLQCDKTFVNSKCYEAHHQRVHLKARWRETWDSRARRDTVDGPKRKAICDVCGKACTSNAALVYHQRTHTGERPYKCSQCPKSFFMPHALIAHQAVHSDERPYSCSVCPKAFKKKISLQLHTRVHTGERPYKCSVCDSSFKQNPHLRIHMKLMHTLTHILSEKQSKKQYDKKKKS